MNDSKRYRMVFSLVIPKGYRRLCLVVLLALSGCSTPEKAPVGGADRAATTGPAQPGKAAPKRLREEKSKAPTPSPAPSRKSQPRYPLVTPVEGLTARVISVNEELRFVVLDFSLGSAPAAEQRLGVYRESVKVGEVRVTRWSSGRNVVANIVSGEARMGDEVRLE